jgi:uncharacterized protein with NAD-binding domain and iron-sulfur cluster
MPPRERLVILGGGAAALTAAFELSRPGWRDRFESITVYQLGWRLGGKGASGRGLHDRIEEHGLHLWLGFYENAFRVMRECYEELGRPADAPLARWEDAFKRSSLVVLQDDHGGAWRHWPIVYPEDDRVPGRPDGQDPPFTIWEYLKRAFELLERLIDSHPALARPAGAVGPAGDRTRLIERLLADAGTLVQGLRAAALATAIALLGAMPDDPARHHARQHDLLRRLLEEFLGWARERAQRSLDGNDAVRHTWQLIEITAACIRGVLRDRLLTDPRGFAAIDDQEFQDWLRASGAPDEALECAVLRGGYDLAFAFRGGDPAHPAMGAGIGLQNAARLFFTYKGALFWRMQAGMGDVVFAPLYLVLRARGVRFRFFHRVTSLRLAADRRSIGAIDLGRQVELVDPSAEYEPLVDVGGLPCWPSEPRWEQVRDAARVRGKNLESFWDAPPDAGALTLRAGTDFDRIVFGISLGSVPHLCSELMEASPRWRDMVAHVLTVPTQAFQLWLNADANALGFKWPGASCSGYVEPFDTYADMEHLLARESWPDAERVKSLAYFCNVLTEPGLPPAAPDPAYAAASDATVKRNVREFLRRAVGQFWPGAVDAGANDFRWEFLAGAGAAQGADRLDAQFWRANVDPSERYVLSLPGTARFRIKPGDTGFDNLVVAGDWTDCGLDAGCVEAAVMSGRLAANALTGMPRLQEIVGYPST